MTQKEHQAELDMIEAIHTIELDTRERILFAIASSTEPITLFEWYDRSLCYNEQDFAKYVQHLLENDMVICCNVDGTKKYSVALVDWDE